MILRILEKRFHKLKYERIGEIRERSDCLEASALSDC